LSFTTIFLHLQGRKQNYTLEGTLQVTNPLSFFCRLRK